MIKQKFIYIIKQEKESFNCKIGKTNDLKKRLKQYNGTGIPADNQFKYLYTCETTDASIVENLIKSEFKQLRQIENKEIYFYNEKLFKGYIDFIEKQKEFVKSIPLDNPPPKQITKIVKRITPTLQERGLTRKDVMQKAKKVANDEFYTRYEDVEKELNMYSIEIWKDKCVFCNCDDALDESNTRNSSAFALFFIRNFQKFNLKKLICTHYAGSDTVDLFNQGARGYIFTKDGFSEIKSMPGENGVPKYYNGSFNDPYSIKILNEKADIVCTNPPFSKAREYWELLIRSGKKFIILSNSTNFINTFFIHWFKNKKVWAGYNEVTDFLNAKKEKVRADSRWYKFYYK